MEYLKKESNMKELSIEQKAKAYDEALEKAKEMIKAMTNIGGIAKVDDIQYLFPELKESDEDENIRKVLVELISTYLRGNENGKIHGVYAKDILTWLEKQDSKILANSAKTCKDEQKPVDVRTTGYWNVQDIEQKPVDKVKPKFHKGEWIVWKNKCYKVNYNGCGYELIDQNGLSTSLEFGTVDTSARLWDVTKDAKDNDILATSAGAFIYNGNNGGGSCPGCYCGINTLGRFKTGVEHHWTGKRVNPATKEQRDILFQKMKESGYEWDADKKELKEIEEKPAQSEEDEKRIKDIIYFLDSAKKHYASIVELNACIDWLKSLRLQNRWKPSEEQMDALLFVVQHYTPKVTDKLAWDSIKILELMYHEIK